MKHCLKLIGIGALFSISMVCQAQQPPTDQAAVIEYLKGVQTQMLTMHDLSNRILAETDPARQQALKNQQLEIMKAQYLQMMSQHQNGG